MMNLSCFFRLFPPVETDTRLLRFFRGAIRLHRLMKMNVNCCHAQYILNNIFIIIIIQRI